MKSTLPKRAFRGLLTVVIICFSVALATSQEELNWSNEKYVVIRQDGREFVGAILEDDGREMLILTDNVGKVYVKKSEIKLIKPISEGKDLYYGQYIPEGVFTTRYVFTTNAHPIKKGDNYSMINLYGPEIHFSVSNHLSLGIMTSWIGSPMILASKYSFARKESKVNFALGGLVGTSSFVNAFRGYGGLGFGAITFGDRLNNVNISAGYADIQFGTPFERTPPGVYTNDSFSLGYLPIERYFHRVRGPVFSLAGTAQVGARVFFVFDSMILLYSINRLEQTWIDILPPDYTIDPPFYGESQLTVEEKMVKGRGIFVMPGLRFQEDEKSAIQLSLAGVSFEGIKRRASFPLPMLSVFHKL